MNEYLYLESNWCGYKSVYEYVGNKSIACILKCLNSLNFKTDKGKAN